MGAQASLFKGKEANVAMGGSDLKGQNCTPNYLVALGSVTHQESTYKYKLNDSSLSLSFKQVCTTQNSKVLNT